MAKTSAALCCWKATSATERPATNLEILIVHPGGPFWKNKDEGAWSLPKGEFDPEAEQPLAAALREFAEETGHAPPDGPFLELGHTTLRSGKIIHAWAAAGDLDAESIRSNLFEIEWPPRSGKRARFPEVDRALWASPDEARRLLNPAQAVFVDRLVAAQQD